MINNIINSNISFIENLSWQDYLEIIIISIFIYKFSLWLTKDLTKNLLLIFYTYFILIFISYYLDLQTLTNIFITNWSFFLFLFIFTHQNTIQKNFIVFKKIIKNPIAESLTETIVKCCLIAINKNKKINILIEKKDSLNDYLETNFKINADLTANLFEILIEKQFTNIDNSIWLDQENKIIAINTKIKSNNLNSSLIIDNNMQEIKNILNITIKSDAIFILINPDKRNFDIIIKNKIAKSINTQELIKILENNLK